MHWDEWLGPAPLREYHDGLHPFSWRSWRQFGTGTLGDMACHVMDGVIWSLKLVEATKFSIACLAQKDGSAEMYTDTYGGGIQLYPEARRQAFANPPKTLPRAHGGPIEDLFWAIKNDGTPASNFVDYSGRLTEFILTGQLAMLAGVGKKLDWDVVAMKCTNHDEINQFVRRKYRPGWEV